MKQSQYFYTISSDWLESKLANVSRVITLFCFVS